MSENNIQAYGQLYSEYYDATEKYASEKEVDFFASFIQKSQGKVLEAMSGSGRLQIPLMQHGYVVDGVDNSQDMLARCHQRCKDLGFEPNLYEQSLEKLSLPYKYGTVIIAFGSLQLIAQEAILAQALKNIHSHMIDGGNLLIDVFVPDVTIDEYSVSTARLDEHRVIRVTKRHVFDVEKKLANTFCLYELVVDGIVFQQENALVEIVWRSDDEWQELLEKAGFEVVKIYDETFKQSEKSHIIHARSFAKN
jgi:SAM-dependent methyltransferase